MSFLTPAFLWAAPLIAAPVVIHLLFLQRARPLWFSDLELLRKAYLKTLPSSRLRQWLLLFLRCLLMALAIGAFSRPVLKAGSTVPGGGAASEEGGLRLVVLLDVSYSMGYRVAGAPRIDLARQVGRQVLAELKPEDKVAVAAFSDKTPSLAWAPSHQAAADALGASLSNRPTDAGAALQAAFAFLAAEPASKKGVVLLSDNAAHAFPSGIPDPPRGIEVVAVDWKDQPANGWLASVDATARGGEAALAIEAEGAGMEGSRAVSLWANGRKSAERSARFPGSVSFELSPADPGWNQGWLELSPDALPADDKFYFARRLAERPSVLVLSSYGDFFDPGRAGRFLKRLFGGPGGTLIPYNVDFLDLGRVRAEDLAAYRAVVLAAGGPISSESASMLRSFVRQGGGLLVVLERNLQPGALAGLSEALPGEPGSSQMVSDGALTAVKAPDTAKFRFDWSDFELEKVRVGRAYPLRLWPDAAVWMTAGGRPMLTERPYGAGRVLLWATSLDPEWTNLPLKPVFAAWFNFCLGQLTVAREAERPNEVAVGKAWRYEAPKPLEGELWIETPDKRRIRLYAKGKRAEFDGTDAPGLYWFEHGGGREPFGVNLDRTGGEPDLARASLPYALIDPESPSEGMRARFFGREVRWAFLYLALFVMGGELMLARGRGEK